jgi:hypothetical protein
VLSPVLRHDHPLNAAVVLDDLEQLPVLRLHQQARHIFRLIVSHFNDHESMITQVLGPFRRQTAIEPQAIVPSIECQTRFIIPHRDGQERQLCGGDIWGVREEEIEARPMWVEWGE